MTGLTILDTHETSPALSPPPVREIAQEVLRDVTQHFHFNTEAWWYAVLHRLAMAPALKFSEIMRDCDIKVASQSLWAAAQDLLTRFTKGWDVDGAEKLPKEGPLLVVANHPGVVDSIALLGVLARPDVHLLVNERPTLQVLPNASAHFIYMDEHDPARVDIMREIIRLLRAGESVALFPKGTLEPDPARYPGALDSLATWSQSLGVFLSQAPDAALQLVLTRNVLSRQAWEHPVAKLGKTLKQRHQIGMILQTALQQFFDVWKIPVRMTLPAPVPARTFSPELDPREINTEIRRYVADEMTKTFELL
ncbi:1-acyl-sn-glycerol-3-phosphate acyltransferase [bacterium]|nr:1-acyl-sn-glycerol-3-phosphate acyltransferase [bacterium]